MLTCRCGKEAKIQKDDDKWLCVLCYYKTYTDETFTLSYCNTGEDVDNEETNYAK